MSTAIIVDCDAIAACAVRFCGRYLPLAPSHIPCTSFHRCNASRSFCAITGLRAYVHSEQFELCRTVAMKSLELVPCVVGRFRAEDATERIRCF